MIFENNKSRSNLAVRPDKWGWEFANLSSRAGIRRTLAGLPASDAILHGKRSYRLVAGPSDALRRADFE